jgi:hypothetical protein
MLTAYLNQSCELLRKTGTDSRGQPVYAGAETIPCRLEEKFQLVTTANGETVPAHHICYTTEQVEAGDKINGLTVHSADTWTDLDGEDIGFKAVM